MKLLTHPTPSGSKVGDETTFICHDCALPHAIKQNGGTGYAVCDNGAHLVCYACADKREREELKDTSRPFTSYVSSDGTKITTWTGGELMRITQSRPWSIFGSRWNKGVSIRAVDCHGKHWYGRGAGRGMCINLRACKA